MWRFGEINIEENDFIVRLPSRFQIDLTAQGRSESLKRKQKEI